MAMKVLTPIVLLDGVEIQNLKLEHSTGAKTPSDDTVGQIYWNETSKQVEVVVSATEIKELSQGGSYVLPAATATSLGGVMVKAESTGSNIAITAAGVIDLTVDTKDKIEKAIRGIKVGPTSSQTTHTVDSDGNVDLGDVVIANDKGLIPQNYLPSYVDDVVEVSNYTALVALGAAAGDPDADNVSESKTKVLEGKIYILLNDEVYSGVTYKANSQWRWSGTTWVEIAKTPDIASEDEAKAGTSDAKFMTPAKTKAAIEELAPVKKVVKKIGDGATTVFAITHDRNSADLAVSVRETASGEVVFVDTVISTTQVTLTFENAPTTDEYTVTIIG
jgi:hypothetical protein